MTARTSSVTFVRQQLPIALAPGQQGRAGSIRRRAGPGAARDDEIRHRRDGSWREKECVVAAQEEARAIRPVGSSHRLPEMLTNDRHVWRTNGGAR